MRQDFFSLVDGLETTMITLSWIILGLGLIMVGLALVYPSASSRVILSVLVWVSLFFTLAVTGYIFALGWSSVVMRDICQESTLEYSYFRSQELQLQADYDMIRTNFTSALARINSTVCPNIRTYATPNSTCCKSLFIQNCSASNFCCNSNYEYLYVNLTIQDPHGQVLTVAQCATNCSDPKLRELSTSIVQLTTLMFDIDAQITKNEWITGELPITEESYCSPVSLLTLYFGIFLLCCCVPTLMSFLLFLRERKQDTGRTCYYFNTNVIGLGNDLEIELPQRTGGYQVQ